MIIPTHKMNTQSNITLKRLFHKKRLGYEFRYICFILLQCIRLYNFSIRQNENMCHIYACAHTPRPRGTFIMHIPKHACLYRLLILFNALRTWHCTNPSFFRFRTPILTFWLELPLVLIIL